MTEKDLLPLTDKFICIVGPQSMQNQLLASFLEGKTGASCLTGMTEEQPEFEKLNGAGVILWDCLGRSPKSLLNEIQGHALKNHLVILFNVNQDASGIEKEAVHMGIRGLVYEHESFDQLPKAVQAVFKGELWLSRDFMSRWILSTKKGGAHRNGDTGLTTKELEILQLLSSGASNKEIAKRLYISTNTAKTHIYNIFKKINVSNRLQAAIWAGKNL